MKRWFSFDRMTDLEPGKRAQALLHVPNTLSIFSTHFPRFPVLPGVLMLGSLTDLAALLLEKETGEPWRVAGADQVRFRHFVQPGDQLTLTVEVQEILADTALLTGMIQVERKKMVTVRQIRLVRCHQEVVA